MSALFSPCGTFRYRLEREVASEGIVLAFFGVNPSKAGATVEDQTTMKWRGFTVRNGGRKYLAGNPFALCATDVRELATAPDPFGPDNFYHLRQIIADADVLVPCWGNRSKLPKLLRQWPENLLSLLLASGKPVKHFGLTQSGDPKHPLMLGYSTPLQDWPRQEQTK